MKYLSQDRKLVVECSPALSGVFLFSDLAVLLAEAHRTALYRRIGALLQDGALLPFKKGVYVTPSYEPKVLSQKIAPQSYISFGTILADTLIVGVTPKLQVDAVKVGKTRFYHGLDLRIRHFGCASHLFFGYDNVHGVNQATPEKALLDTFYFHQHGTKFPFDIYSDVDWSRIDKQRVAEYLPRYRNDKFVKFFQGIRDASA